MFAILAVSWAVYDVQADSAAANESLRWPEPIPNPWYQGWVGKDLYDPSDLVASGRVNAWDDSKLTYRIITSNPFCTAVYVDGMVDVSRLTILRSKVNYHGEVMSGIPLLVQVPENLANSTIQSLLERPLIRSVQMISPSLSSPYINYNADIPDRERMPTCNPSLDGGVQDYLYEYLIYQDHLKNAILDAGLAQDFIASFRMALHNYEPPHSVSPGILYNAHIRTKNLTSTETFLRDNSVKIRHSGPSVFPDGRVLPGYYIYADVPYSIILPLTERDEVTSVTPPSPITHFSHGFGDIHTEGLDEHDHATQWHDLGYNGTGIKVGVIDLGFRGIQDAIKNGELPAPTYNCGEIGGLNRCDFWSRSSHGTRVAEIVMDMAPGAELFIARADNITGTYDMTEWMIKQDVDIIVQSSSHVVFEGPGDGT